MMSISRTVTRRMSTKAAVPAIKEVLTPRPKPNELALKMLEDSNEVNTVTRTKSFMSRVFNALPPSGYKLERPEDRAALSGIPSIHKGRRVLIQPVPVKSTQSYFGGHMQWQVTWEAGTRWNNPFTGWSSTSDPFANAELHFGSAEEAVAYCESHGWKYTKLAPLSSAPTGVYKYADLFLNKKVRNHMKHEGADWARKHFNNPKYGHSHWFMPLTYDGSAPVVQHGPPATAATGAATAATSA